MPSLDREVRGSTMVAWTGTELAVYIVEDSPKEEANLVVNMVEYVRNHDFCFFIKNVECTALLHGKCSVNAVLPA